MRSTDFKRIALEWNTLLSDEAHRKMMMKHMEFVTRIAMALAQSDELDWNTIHDQFKTEKDEQTFLALVMTIQELIQVIVRERMIFLLDEEQLIPPSSDSRSGGTMATTPRIDDHTALRKLLPPEFGAELLNSLRIHWSNLERSASNSLRLTTLLDCKWRILPPFVLLRLTTSDQSTRTIKVPLQQFYQLRYQTAKLLQDMASVEAHPIMRLTQVESNLGAP